MSNGNGGYEQVDGLNTWINDSAGTAAIDISRLKFIDFNADGLTDIYKINGWGSTTRDKVYLSKGDGTFDIIDGLNTWIVNSLSGAPIDISRINFGDFNGDGLTDIYKINGWGNSNLDTIYTNNQNFSWLQSITNSNGTTTSVSYKPLTDPSVYTKGSGSTFPTVDLQYPQYVVNQVTADNGVGGTTSVRYHYEGLRVDVQGRGLLGYSQITETYPDTGKSQTAFFDSRGFPYTGQIIRAEERYNGDIINESTNSYEAVETQAGVYQVNFKESVQRSYELGNSTTPITTVTTTHTNVDAFGNIGRIIVTTEGGGETFTKITDSEYNNDTTNWYLGRLTETTVTHQSPYSADEQRRTAFTYDNTTGLLATESVVSVTTGLPLSTKTNSYDSYGQITQITLSAEGEQDRISTTQYDNLGRPTQSCNQLNQCETHTYTSEGWLVSTTGPNGITTNWVYDGLGRKIRENRADGTYTSTQLYFVDSGQCGELAPFAHTCSVTQASGTSPVIVQLDTFGREVRKITQSFDERQVYKDSEYNHLSQLTRISREYYPGNQRYWATSEYDALDRVVRLTEPGPHGSITEINTDYDGLITRVSGGPEARVKTTTLNAIGQKILVQEEEGAYTEFTYNSDGNLLTTRVAGDSATTITLYYDEFGRKIAMDDPDMGEWSYSYDAFGQLTSQTDAKGQNVTTQYDILGRMISRTEPEGTSTWEYYDNNAPAGSIGKLKQESGPGISKTLSYDNLGRPVSATTTIEGQGSFTSETEYDSFGRVARVTYPGTQGFYTENVYNDQGYLAAIRGLRSQAEQHDYSALQPLIQQAVDLADDYLANASELRVIGNYYQSQIAFYQSLTGSGELSTELKDDLQQHQNQLSATVTQGQNLSPEFLGHLNNTIIELQTVTNLIDTQIHDYQAAAEQLTLLAEQTLAAADHSFQFERTLDHAADAYGYMLADNDYITYWRAVDVDASGRISAEVYGNGIVNDYAYNQATGQLQSIHSSLLVVDAIRHLEYQYDAYQNVTLRDDLVNDIRETYDYDRLDRLTATHVNSDLYNTPDFNTTHSLSYDMLGNITHKSDVGDYAYIGAGPHAVTQAGGNSYSYDTNGNMTSGAGRTIQWSSFNKPTQITQDGRSASFSYGPDRSRFKKVNHRGDITLYLGHYERTTKADSTIEQKHYIYAAGQVVAEHILSTTEGTQTRYLHKDALGSVDLVTDAYGNVVDRRSFDAWGKLRNLPWKENATLDDPLYLTQLPFTNKGYTGHEHVQEVDLIHMNGRMYDATLARFISADPHIQADSLSQSYNRYSYVLNNPMKYTDPSGYFFKKLFKSLKKLWNAVKPYVGVILGAAVAVFCAVCGANIINAAITGAVIGAVSVAAVGGNILQGALIGAFTAGAAKWIGGATGIFGKARFFDIGRSIVHGIVGGVTNVIRGGKFGAGFISSAFTKMVSAPIQGFAEAVSGGVDGLSDIVGAAGAALVGGTASVLGGGKFANGAQTAAIQYLFNQVGKSRADQKQKELEDSMRKQGVPILTSRDLKNYRDVTVGPVNVKVKPGVENSIVPDVTLGDLANDAGRLSMSIWHQFNYQFYSSAEIVLSPYKATDYYAGPAIDAVEKAAVTVPQVNGAIQQLQLQVIVGAWLYDHAQYGTYYNYNKAQDYWNNIGKR